MSISSVILHRRRQSLSSLLLIFITLEISKAISSVTALFYVFYKLSVFTPQELRVGLSYWNNSIRQTSSNSFIPSRSSSIVSLFSRNYCIKVSLPLYIFSSAVILSSPFGFSWQPSIFKYLNLVPFYEFLTLISDSRR